MHTFLQLDAMTDCQLWSDLYLDMGTDTEMVRP